MIKSECNKPLVSVITPSFNQGRFIEDTLCSIMKQDYPNIEQLATTAARRLEPLKVSISMPSLRPGTISPALLDAARRVRKAGLTIAPEAGTERLRRFIRSRRTRACG